MSINLSIIEPLLYEEESTTLDFKREQYPFQGEPNDTKSELLKDILAFTNAWRRTDAYILVGVEEVNGGKSIVKGVSNHLNDSDLQQFINSKTQKPIDFHYFALELESKQVGVIHISPQNRPIYLKKDYGKLKKDTVYIRRGTSTDIASLDEIAEMGKAEPKAVKQIPILDIQFGNFKQKSLLGTTVKLETINSKLPPDDVFPNFGTKGRYYGIMGENPDYYREMAKFYKDRFFFGNVGFAITNSSEYLANDVRFEIELPDNGEFKCCEESDLAEKSSKDRMGKVSMRVSSVFSNKDVKITHTGSTYFIEGSIGKLQPQQTDWTANQFFIGSEKSQSINIPVKIFADNIPSPKQCELKIELDVSQQELNLDSFIKHINDEVK